jgi:uncharacterized protein YkwD
MNALLMIAAMLLAAPVETDAENAPAVNKAAETAQPAANKEEARQPRKGSPSKKNKKKKANDTQDAKKSPEASGDEQAAQDVPLHEHPTLLAMLKRNNEIRASVGLEPQRINLTLCKASQDNAVFMARTGHFDHRGPNGSPWDRAARYGYNGSVRENIAYGYYTVADAFKGWRNSRSHWDAMICDAPECGFGYYIADSGRPYWVTLYGYPEEVTEDTTAETNDPTENQNDSINVAKSDAAADDSRANQAAGVASAEQDRATPTSDQVVAANQENPPPPPIDDIEQVTAEDSAPVATGAPRPSGGSQRRPFQLFNGRLFGRR